MTGMLHQGAMGGAGRAGHLRRRGAGWMSGDTRGDQAMSQRRRVLCPPIGFGRDLDAENLAPGFVWTPPGRHARLTRQNQGQTNRRAAVPQRLGQSKTPRGMRPGGRRHRMLLSSRPPTRPSCIRQLSPSNHGALELATRPDPQAEDGRPGFARNKGECRAQDRRRKRQAQGRVGRPGG